MRVLQAVISSDFAILEHNTKNKKAFKKEKDKLKNMMHIKAITEEPEFKLNHYSQKKTYLDDGLVPSN